MKFITIFENNRVIDLVALSNINLNIKAELKGFGKLSYIDVLFDDAHMLDTFKIYCSYADNEADCRDQYEITDEVIKKGRLNKRPRGYRYTSRDISRISNNKPLGGFYYSYKVIGSADGYPTREFLTEIIFVPKVAPTWLER